MAKIYDKNETSIQEVVQKEKESHTSFTVTPWTAKVTATVTFGAKCLVKMIKPLNLFNEIFWERPYSCKFYYSILL